MKKTTKQRLAPLLFIACLLIAGAAYSLGMGKYTFQLANVHVAIYPAAFLALVGVVQLVSAYLPGQKGN